MSSSGLHLHELLIESTAHLQLADMQAYIHTHARAHTHTHTHRERERERRHFLPLVLFHSIKKTDRQTVCKVQTDRQTPFAASLFLSTYVSVCLCISIDPQTDEGFHFSPSRMSPCRCSFRKKKKEGKKERKKERTWSGTTDTKEEIQREPPVLLSSFPPPPSVINS
mmetsp:Transcript_45531/g.89690  ORF Transcript_45531/g.89690 Transcript_45531/m.89690 type:complete len:167 (-) Transcript_45531:584-1084(-)